jgi:hypothetical protein
VICGAFSLDFDEDGARSKVLAIPFLKGLEGLNAEGLGINDDLNVGGVSRWCLIGVLPLRVAPNLEQRYKA